MVRGSLDIKRLSNTASTSDIYEVYFQDLSGDTYTASMTGEEVEELIFNRLRLNMEIEDIHSCIDDLKRSGRVFIADIETGKADLVGSGLRYLPYAG